MLIHHNFCFKQYNKDFKKKKLFIQLKTITSYQNSGFKPVKNIFGRYKINLEALKG
jgi:hypothetical protein